MSYATRLHLFGDRDLTEDREKFKTVSKHAKYRMEGVKERYGKAATEEVEYEEGEVEYDRAGGVLPGKLSENMTHGVFFLHCLFVTEYFFWLLKLTAIWLHVLDIF
ncbi:hypothetical protein RHSIM_Rhsim05G0203600 [Rhododendron simsii]|uniref:Uncharacterized protein n=1 Tax=Rhododendron simsii TaxID=118357 RepID=A0A834GXY7_RHOSS|nr:hypothetical protein RHSIM_Rhsim05G0203600 [Rhododendron simsii]